MWGSIQLAKIIFWNLSRCCAHGFVKNFLARLSISGKNPDILDIVEATKTSACVDDGVGVVVGLNNLVISSRDERSKFDFKVAVVIVGINLEGLTDTATPFRRVILPLIVNNSDVAIVSERVLSSVADTIKSFESAISVSSSFIP